MAYVKTHVATSPPREGEPAGTKCLERYTENPNESVHSIIVKLCPKHKNHGLSSVNASVALAVELFNDGVKTYVSVMKKLKLSVGTFMELYISEEDAARVRHAQRQAHLTFHEARIVRRRTALTLNEQQTGQKGSPYQAGA